jgi:hypothetical protein
MSKRLIISNLIMLAMGLMSLPVSQAQLSTQETSLKFSAYQDDPFVEAARIGKMQASSFNIYEGHRILFNSRAFIEDENVVYRENSTGDFIPFAFNPWPIPIANEKGNFKFQNEERFPLFNIVRGPDGKPILTDGLQTWNPIDCYLGMTTTFKAANDDKDAAEFWAGRDINWGNLFNGNYVMFINSHSFIDFNAFYAPGAKQLFFGVTPYRLPGDPTVRIFETATSWEVAAHECGHALHHTLKPNVDLSDAGFRVWAESLADQTAMWTSLRDKDRARSLLQEVGGNLVQSNSLTRMAEAFAKVVGEGTAMRDAFHEKKVSDTSEEVHNRSEVLTGASYNLFLNVYNRLKNQPGMTEMSALRKAGEIMGTFNIRSTDYTPENIMTLEDVAKSYLKIDKELYGSQYRDFLVSEFIKREIFDESSEAEWMEHEAAVPDLKLSPNSSNQDIDQFVQNNLDQLGIGLEFGLKLQSVVRDRRFRQTIVRVQLTDGRGNDAELFENHGILVFRKDGTLADYHSPLPSTEGLQTHMQMQAKARTLIDKARQFHIDRHDTPLSFVRRPDKQLTVEARVMRNKGFYSWVEAFTLEHPEGERREVITRTLPNKLSGLQPGGVQILTADDLQ